jgi:hypothetical protein
LEDYAEQTLSALRKLKGRGAEFWQLQIDATIQGKLGKFFAAKLRSGVFYSFYLRTNDPEVLRKAIAESRAGRATWAELANTAKNVYREDVTYGPDYYQRGHWMDRLEAIDADIADLEKVLGDSAPNTGNAIDWKRLGDAMERANQGRISWKSSDHTSRLLSGFHTPPALFRRGEDLALTIQSPSGGGSTIAAIQLQYRHVNQSELWQQIEMKQDGNKFAGTIPAPYTDSPFPLQYYFRTLSASGNATLRPGLETRFNGQPYFLVRQV